MSKRAPRFNAGLAIVPAGRWGNGDCLPGGKYCARRRPLWGDPRRRSEVPESASSPGPGGRAQPCDCPCHFQNKPGRCSKGKRVNLMTPAISSSRNLLTLPSGKSCVLQKSGHLPKKRKTEPERHIPHVGLRFHHAPHAPVAAGGRWNVNRHPLLRAGPGRRPAAPGGAPA